MVMRTLADEVALYMERILPTDAGIVQTVETKRAFYSGAASMLKLVTTDLPVDEDEAIKCIGNLRSELREFRERISKGKA